MSKRLEELVAISEKPAYTIAVCEDCGWEGCPSDCDTYMEDDGWESSNFYMVAICPKCDEENVIFLTEDVKLEMVDINIEVSDE